MAGIGPINRDLDSILTLARQHSATPTNASELEIFYRLAIGRVLYRPHSGLLYYVDSPALSISSLIEAVFKGLDREANIEQLYMDQNKILRAAFRIQLAEEERAVVLTALRLRGLEIDQVR